MLTDVGQVQLRFATLVPGAEIAQLDVMLTGEDGSAFTIRSAKEPITVPVGRYTVATLAISLNSKAEVGDTDDRDWRFVFSDLGSPRRKTWFEVEANQTANIDPVGKISFSLDFGGDENKAARGQRLHVQPRLFTQGGLLINTGGCESSTSTETRSAARLSLRGRDSTVVATAQSGFA
jgi:hypothetical protein